MQNNFQNMGGHMYPPVQGQYGQQLPYQTPVGQQQFQQAAAGHRPAAGAADEIDFDDIPSDEDDAGPGGPNSGPAAANLLQLQQAQHQQQLQQQAKAAAAAQAAAQLRQQQQQQQQYLLAMHQQQQKQQQQLPQQLQRPPAQQQARHMSTPAPTSHVRTGLHPGAMQPAQGATSQQQQALQALQQARQQQQQQQQQLQRPSSAQGIKLESGIKRPRSSDGPPPAPEDAVPLYEVLFKAAKAGVLQQPSAATGAGTAAGASAAAAAAVPTAEGPAQAVDDLLRRTQSRAPPADAAQGKLREEDKVMQESGMRRLLELQALNKAFKFGPGVVEQLQRLTQDFVSDTVSFGVELASHRRGATLRPTDLATYLERTHHLHVPGFTKEYHPYRRPAASELHRERSVAVRKAQLAPQQAGGDGAAGAAAGGGRGGGGGD